LTISNSKGPLNRSSAFHKVMQLSCSRLKEDFGNSVNCLNPLEAIEQMPMDIVKNSQALETKIRVETEIEQVCHYTW
jgi:hypothetical protein